MNNEDYKVSSELYEEQDYTSPAKPVVDINNVVSKFLFKFPEYVDEDCDGDLIVPRRKTKGKPAQFIEIEHSKSTTLHLVGLQIWRGSLLLADWLLHNGKTLPKDLLIMELGSGVGLASIVASLFAPVICTDIDKGHLFKLIESNISRNKHITKYPIKTMELDFMAESFSKGIEDVLSTTSVILAADVIYDDDITEGFVRTIQKLIRGSSRTLYVALERRYVFTIADCDSVAPCYEYFLERLNKLQGISADELVINFPKYFSYDRVKELVLWKITSL